MGEALVRGCDNGGKKGNFTNEGTASSARISAAKSSLVDRT